jgi:probable HAF family extracellular repeat protein
MLMDRCQRIAVLFGIAALLLACPAISSEYNRIDLGTMAGGNAIPAACNDRGEVVGSIVYDFENGSRPIAFLWEDGQMTLLPGLETAESVNGRGQIVGTILNDGFTQVGLLEHGALTDLGTLGEGYSIPTEISEGGVIVGYASVPEVFGPVPFVWEQGAMHRLPTLGGATGSAQGVNRAGEIVGGSQTAAREWHASLWRNGKAMDLGTLGGNWSTAEDLNDRGEVVGGARTPEGLLHATLWRGGAAIDIGTLGGLTSYANSINARGLIVGGSSVRPGDPFAPVHACVWEDGIPQDLGTLGGETSEAKDINERGWIVGASQTASGEWHAVLWVPAGSRPADTAEQPDVRRSGKQGALYPTSALDKAAAVVSEGPTGPRLWLNVPRAGSATIHLFDVSGRFVRTIWESKSVQAGRYEIPIRSDGARSSLPKGIYFYRARVSGATLSGKLLIPR